MRKLFLTVVLIFTAHLATAQDAFKKDVLKYLEVSNQAATFEMITRDIVKNIPAEKQADFKKELDASIKDLMNKMADMYMTEFTHNDIKEVIKFYESPVGKKLASKTEVLYEKGQVVGQEWGMNLQGVIMKYVE